MELAVYQLDVAVLRELVVLLDLSVHQSELPVKSMGESSCAIGAGGDIVADGAVGAGGDTRSGIASIRAGGMSIGAGGAINQSDPAVLMELAVISIGAGSDIEWSWW